MENRSDLVRFNRREDLNKLDLNPGVYSVNSNCNYPEHGYYLFPEEVEELKRRYGHGK